jgi:hypothetical protein
MVEFNMGAASMARVDALIRKIVEYKSILYVGGSPMHSLILRLLRALYVEVYPYLDKEEVEYATKSYIDVFKDNPIVNTGNSLLLPKITEDTMEDFELWLMGKMMDKGILTKIGVSPYETMI